MDGNMILATGLASLALKGGVMCYNKNKKAKKLYKTKLSSLIIPMGCGKSALKKHLQSLSSSLVIIDLNSVIEFEGVDNLEYMANAKKYVDGILKQFPKKRFLLLLSTREESEYLGVDATNSFVVCPSIELFEKIKGDIDPVTDNGLQKKNELEKARLGLIRETDSEMLNIFSSFDELYSVIKTVYKLQSTF